VPERTQAGSGPGAAEKRGPAAPVRESTPTPRLRPGAVPVQKSPATPAPPKAAIPDDFEEETRVLRTPAAGSAVDPALQRLAGGTAGQHANEFDAELVEENTDFEGGWGDLPGQAGEAVTSPQLSIPRLPSVPAIRVAVMSAGAPGEVQLVPLDAATKPPPGAAVAILVPISAADGELVVKLFGSRV
jgi:hypothetical protein